MTIDELKEKMDLINKAKNIIREKYYVKDSISWGFYKEYIRTMETIQISLLQQYDESNHYAHDYRALPYFSSFGENKTIRISIDTVIECRFYCGVGSDIRYPQMLGKVMIY
jgi:hypothetical protein